MRQDLPAAELRRMRQGEESFSQSPLYEMQDLVEFIAAPVRDLLSVRVIRAEDKEGKTYYATAQP